jgi:hypothetical protein
MKFNPITMKLYTNSGIFLKRIECPLRKNWNQLEDKNQKTRKCKSCDRKIINTEFLSDKNLLEMLREDPNTCLKINLKQNNLNVVAYEII